MLCVGYTDENRGATLFRHLEENRRYTIPILIDDYHDEYDDFTDDELDTYYEENGYMDD